MNATVAGLAALTGPFVTESALRGARPPVRLLDADSHGWVLLERDGDALVLDEFGEVWWARVQAGGVRTMRAPWPEEIRRLRSVVEHALARLRHTAAPGRR